MVASSTVAKPHLHRAPASFGTERDQQKWDPVLRPIRAPKLKGA
jgi:hypothetical protein